MGSDMVDVYVGADRIHFHVHQRLLCNKAPVFDKMFNGGFSEAGKKSAELPDDDPKAFDSFLQWVYRDQVAKVDLAADLANASTEGGQLCDAIMLYCFAEKYCIDALADSVMNAILEAFVTTPCAPSAEETTLVYDNTSEGSRLRLYIARCFTYQLHVDYTATYTASELDFFAGKPDFCRDVFAVLLRWQTGSYTLETIPLPTNELWCDYHRHGQDEICVASPY
jgi:hypothetical protein